MTDHRIPPKKKQSPQGFEYLVRSIPFVLILVAGVGVLIGSFTIRDAPQTQRPVSLAPLVETVALRVGGDELHVEADGEVIPFRQISLASQVSGRIVHKTEACQAGQYVHKGELLVQIDPRDSDLEVRRTQELIKQTEVSIEELDVEIASTRELIALAEQDKKLQQNELDRIRKLIDRKATSQAALDTALRSGIQVDNTLQTLQSQSQVLRTRRGRLLSDKDRLLVDLEKAMLDRERCDIVSPMDGVVVRDAVEQDDFVQRGTTLVQVEDTDRVEVRFELKLNQLRWIWMAVEADGSPEASVSSSYRLPDLPVDVSVEMEGQRFTWKGRLARYDDAGLNPATRTVPCIAYVDQPREAENSENRAAIAPPVLLRGMFVKVAIQVPSTQPLIEIPWVALRPGDRIWLLRDERLTVAAVTVAQAGDDRVLLFDDPSINQDQDRLIVSPLALAVNGMKVREEPATIPVADLTEQKKLNGLNGHDHRDQADEPVEGERSP